MIYFQFSDVKKACKHWNYPETVGMTRDKTRTDQFYEGDFLHMLLEKLSHLLDQVLLYFYRIHRYYVLLSKPFI